MTAAAKSKAAKRMQRLRAKGGAFVAPTSERYQHGRIKVGETIAAGQAVAVETRQRWIDAYAELGQITDRQWTAADKLWRTWYTSGIQKGCTGAYEGGSGGAKGRKGGMRPRNDEPATEPYTDVWRALDRLQPDERVVVRSVVLFDEPAELSVDGIAVLRYGLDRMADAYGLPKDVV